MFGLNFASYLVTPDLYDDKVRGGIRQRYKTMKSVKVISFVLSALVLAMFATKTHAAAVPCAFGSGFECVVNAGDTLAGGIVVPNSGNDKEMYSRGRD